MHIGPGGPGDSIASQGSEQIIRGIRRLNRISVVEVSARLPPGQRCSPVPPEPFSAVFAIGRCAPDGTRGRAFSGLKGHIRRRLQRLERYGLHPKSFFVSHANQAGSKVPSSCETGSSAICGRIRSYPIHISRRFRDLDRAPAGADSLDPFSIAIGVRIAHRRMSAGRLEPRGHTNGRSPGR